MFFPGSISPSIRVQNEFAVTQRTLNKCPSSEKILNKAGSGSLAPAHPSSAPGRTAPTRPSSTSGMTAPARPSSTPKPPGETLGQVWGPTNHTPTLSRQNFDPMLIVGGILGHAHDSLMATSSRTARKTFRQLQNGTCSDCLKKNGIKEIKNNIENLELIINAKSVNSEQKNELMAKLAVLKKLAEVDEGLGGEVDIVLISDVVEHLQKGGSYKELILEKGATAINEVLPFVIPIVMQSKKGQSSELHGNILGINQMAGDVDHLQKNHFPDSVINAVVNQRLQSNTDYAESAFKHLKSGGTCSQLVQTAGIFAAKDSLPYLFLMLKDEVDSSRMSTAEANQMKEKLTDLSQIATFAGEMKTSNYNEDKINFLACTYLKMCENGSLLDSFPAEVTKDYTNQLLQEEKTVREETDQSKDNAGGAGAFQKYRMQKLSALNDFLGTIGVQFNEPKNKIPGEIILSSILEDQNGSSLNPWPMTIKTRLLELQNLPKDPTNVYSVKGQYFNYNDNDEFQKKYPSYESYEMAFDQALLSWQAFTLLFNNKVKQPAVDVEKQTMTLVRFEQPNYKVGAPRSVYVSTYSGGKPGDDSELVFKSLGNDSRSQSEAQAMTDQLAGFRTVSVNTCPFVGVSGNSVLGFPCKNYKESEVLMISKNVVESKTYVLTKEEVAQWRTDGKLPASARQMKEGYCLEDMLTEGDNIFV